VSINEDSDDLQGFFELALDNASSSYAVTDLVDVERHFTKFKSGPDQRSAGQ